MYAAYVEAKNGNKSQSVSNADSQKLSSGEPTFRFVDNRPEAIAQRKVKLILNNSLRARETAQLQATINSYHHPQPFMNRKNKGRAVAYSVAQCKSGEKHGHGLVDNRSNTIYMNGLQVKEIDKAALISLSRNKTTVRTREAEEPKANEQASVIQRILQIGSDQAFKTTIRNQLAELAGKTANVRLRDGFVELEDLDEESTMKLPGFRLIRDLINNAHTVTIAPVGADRKMMAEPHLPPNTWAGKLLDLIKSPQFMRRRGFLTHEARAFVSGATETVGVDSTVYHDVTTTDEERNQYVREGEHVRIDTAPQCIGLGHELIHALHFQEGLAAYDQRGQPIEGITQHTFTKQPRGEIKHQEEINTVGLAMLQEGASDHIHFKETLGKTDVQSELTDRDRQARKITENDLRAQLGLNPRAGYERPPLDSAKAIYNEGR